VVLVEVEVATVTVVVEEEIQAMVVEEEEGTELKDLGLESTNGINEKEK